MTKKTENTQAIESMMSEALLRSGYLMESRIVHALVKNGFFVEPNQRIKDPTTGKSREIDLIAELWDFSRTDSDLDTKVSVNVHFVCEAKNNPFPIVLLTELPNSPNLETWDSLYEGTTGIFRHTRPEPSFFDFLMEEQKPYTQYCSFKPKKNGKESEWLAWHPEDFHDDLEKIVTYCRSEAKLIEDFEDNYHRLFLYIPVVILASDLYVAKPQDTTVALSKVNYGLHMHFGIDEEVQRLSLVLFVTEENYLTLFNKIIEFGQNTGKKVGQKMSIENKRS